MARTRSFDRDQALDQAMLLFWQHGYEGTSLEQLTAKLQIGKPSLYAAFGNKRSLFMLAVDRYMAAAALNIDQALAEPNIEDAMRAYLAIYVCPRPGAPDGCLMVQSALVSSPESADVQQEVAQRRGEAEQLVLKRLQRALKEGELNPDAKPADLARYVVTLGQGLAVQTRSGATQAQRQRVVDLAIAGWPGRRHRS